MIAMSTRLRIAAVCAPVLTAMAVIAVLAGGDPRAAKAGTSRTLCGTERWTVKTLQDRPRLLPVRTVTLAYLDSRPAPTFLPATRLPFERHIFRVTAKVTLVRSEADSDLHLVLSDGQ